MMTVEELIKELKRHDKRLPVTVAVKLRDGHVTHTINRVVNRNPDGQEKRKVVLETVS